MFRYKLQSRTLRTVSALLSCSFAVVASGPASAQDSEEKFQRVDHGSLSGRPVMAIISIKDQRISLYDADGAAMRAPISSGQKGIYDTPVGTYSVLEKNREHYSNQYDDAAMPFMQRITWSGVALHQGVLPGYPASHGCVRLPESFAEQIFPLTKIGMRVIISRDNIAPVPISHPALFKPAPVNQSVVADRTAFEPTATEKSGSVFEPDLTDWPERRVQLEALRAAWFKKSAEYDKRKQDVEDIKAEVAQVAKPQTAAQKALKSAERVKKSADENVARAAAALASAKDPKKLKPFEAAKAKADDALAKANERTQKAAAALEGITNDKARKRAEAALRTAERAKAAAQKQADKASRDLAAAQSPSRYKKQEEALARATSAAAAVAQKHAVALATFEEANKLLEAIKKKLSEATTAMETAEAAASYARRKTIPVSMFVSLKTQRLYVRQGHHPIAEYPITISEPEKPIGTFIYTAVSYEKGAENLRWTAVSLGRRAGREVAELTKKSKKDLAPEPYPTDAGAAAAALDRITIPPEVLKRFETSMWPGSSLIVSDEAMHKETNNATDFIVLISGEPQGGIMKRPKPKPAPVQQYVFDDGYGYRTYYAPGSRAYRGYPQPGYGVYGRRPIRVSPPKSIFGFW